METSFGPFFHARRIATGLTLRQFCERHALDPGNISKLERGIAPPPVSRKKLEEYAQHLGLKRGRDDWRHFLDLAAVGRGRIPGELMARKTIVDKLPVLFRTLRGNQIDGTMLDELVKVIRKSRRA